MDQILRAARRGHAPGTARRTTEVTVPGGPPPAGTPGTATTWDADSLEFYFLVHASGDLEFLSGSLAVSGDFNMLITEDVIDISVSAKRLGVRLRDGGLRRCHASTAATSSATSRATARPSTRPPTSRSAGPSVLHIDTADGEYWVDVPNAQVNLFGLSDDGRLPDRHRLERRFQHRDPETAIP